MGMTTTLSNLIDHPLVVDATQATEDHIISYNPATGEPIAAVRRQSREEYNEQVERCQAVFKEWRITTR